MGSRLAPSVGGADVRLYSSVLIVIPVSFDTLTVALHLAGSAVCEVVSQSQYGRPITWGQLPARQSMWSGEQAAPHFCLRTFSINRRSLI